MLENKNNQGTMDKDITTSESIDPQIVVASIDDANLTDEMSEQITNKESVEKELPDYEYAVEMTDITKTFLNGKVVANDKINLRVKKTKSMRSLEKMERVNPL